MKSTKDTRGRQPSGKRRYDDACGTAFALDLIGERWALLVIRELIFGPKRFSDLRSDLPGISANVLTQRLAGLEASGVLRRRRLPPPAASTVYELTEWGYEAEPILMILGRWATRSPGHDPSLPLSAASIMMSFRTMIDPVLAAKMPAIIGFRFGEDGYVATIGGGGIDVERTEPDVVDLLVITSPETLAGLVYGGVDPRELEKAGALRIEGDRTLIGRFAALFTLPVKFEAVSADSVLGD